MCRGRRVAIKSVLKASPSIPAGERTNTSRSAPPHLRRQVSLFTPQGTSHSSAIVGDLSRYALSGATDRRSATSVLVLAPVPLRWLDPVRSRCYQRCLASIRALRHFSCKTRCLVPLRSSYNTSSLGDKVTQKLRKTFSGSKSTSCHRCQEETRRYFNF